mgnify:CR=1 FL=1
MQEKVVADQSDLFIKDENLKKGSNVRPAGSEIKKGDLALEAGALLTPAAIGLLASMGVDIVKVYPHPKISLIITGKELQRPGKPLTFGQVYESNSLMLRESAFEQTTLTMAPGTPWPVQSPTAKMSLSPAVCIK